MKDPNKNRKGYWKSKVGWIPEGWEEARLQHICSQPISGYSPVCQDRKAKPKEIGVLKVSCIQQGRFIETENKLAHNIDHGRLVVSVQKDSLIMSRSNTPELVGAVCFVHQSFPNRFLSDLLWLVHAKDSKTTALKWLNYLLGSSRYRRIISAKGNGTSGTMLKITKNSFLHIPIPLPPLPEQKKIAEILGTWDEAIEKLEALIREKEQLKKGLMQQLLTGKKRLKEFEGEEWVEHRFGDVFTERVETNRPDLPLLSITGNNGVVNRNDLEKRDTSNADKSKYRRIAPRDIGYNTMRMWQGVSALSTLEGIVSPAYTIVIPNKSLDGEYIKHLFKLPEVIHLLFRYSQGLVDDTRNLKFNHFRLIHLKFPPLAEQQAIAQVLDTIGLEIQDLKNLQTRFTSQKKGLMQKLLTGQVRVNHLIKEDIPA